MKRMKRILALVLCAAVLLPCFPVIGHAAAEKWSVRCDSVLAGTIRIELYDAAAGASPQHSWNRQNGVISADAVPDALFPAGGDYYAVVQQDIPGSSGLSLTDEQIEAEFALYLSVITAGYEEYAPPHYPNETKAEAMAWYEGIYANEDYREYARLDPPEEFFEDIAYEYAYFCEKYEETRAMYASYGLPCPFMTEDEFFVNYINKREQTVCDYLGYHDIFDPLPYTELDAEEKRSEIELFVRYPSYAPEGYTPPSMQGDPARSCTVVKKLSADEQRNGFTIGPDFFSSCVPVTVSGIRIGTKWQQDPVTYQYTQVPKYASCDIFRSFGDAVVPVVISGSQEAEEDPSREAMSLSRYGFIAGTALTGRTDPSVEYRLEPGSYLAVSSYGAYENSSDEDACIDWESFTVTQDGGSVGFGGDRGYVTLGITAASPLAGGRLTNCAVSPRGGVFGNAAVSQDVVDSYSIGYDDDYDDYYGSGLMSFAEAPAVLTDEAEPCTVRIRPGEFASLELQVGGLRMPGDYSEGMQLVYVGWELPLTGPLTDGTLLQVPSPDPAVLTKSLVFRDADGGRGPFAPGTKLTADVLLTSGDYRLTEILAVSMSYIDAYGNDDDPDYTFDFLRTEASFADGTPVVTRADNAAVRFGLTAPEQSKTVEALSSIRFGPEENRIIDLSFRTSAVLPVGAGADTVPPAVPEGFSAVTSGESVFFRWNANSEADLAGYRLYLCSPATGAQTLLASPEKDKTEVSLPVNYNSWGEGPWFFALSAADTTGSESALCATVEARDAADLLLGSGSYSASVGSLSDGSLLLNGSNEGTLRFVFTPEDGTDAGTLPEELELSVRYRDLANEDRSIGITLSRSQSGYAGELEILPDMAVLRTAVFRYETAAGTKTAQNLDLDGLSVVANVSLSFPDPAEYPLVSYFDRVSYRANYADSVSFSPSETGYVLRMPRKLFRAAHIDVNLLDEYFTVPGTLLDYLSPGDSFSVPADSLPQYALLRLNIENTDRLSCSVRAVLTSPSGETEDDYLLEFLDDDRSPTGLYLFRPDMEDIDRIFFSIYPYSYYDYELSFSSGEELLEEPGVEFRPGACYDISAAVRVINMPRYMYFDVLAGEGTPDTDLLFNLTDTETGLTAQCTWHYLVCQLDTGSLIPGNHYLAELAYSGLLPDEPCVITAIQDGSNFSDRPSISFRETTQISMQAMFQMDRHDLASFPGCFASLDPDYTVFYWDTGLNDWAELQGTRKGWTGSLASVYRSELLDLFAERDLGDPLRSGLVSEFTSELLPRDSIDTSKGLKLVLSDTAALSVTDSSYGSDTVYSSGSAKLLPGQVIYTNPSMGNSSENLTVWHLRQFSETQGEYGSENRYPYSYFISPTQSVLFCDQDEDYDYPFLVAGVRMADPPRVRMTLTRDLIPQNVTILLRGRNDPSAVYRFAERTDRTIFGGYQKDFSLSGLPYGSYDLLLYFEGGTEQQMLEKRFLEGYDVTIPETVSGCFLEGLTITPENASVDMESPAPAVDRSAAGLQGVSVSGNKTAATAGDRLSFSLHFTLNPGAAVGKRTLILTDFNHRMVFDGITCSIRDENGAAVSVTPTQDPKTRNYTVVLPQTDSVLRGTIIVTGLVNNNESSSCAYFMAAVDGQPGYVAQYYTGMTQIIGFSADIPKTVSENGAVLSGRGSANAEHTVRIASVEHPETVSERSFTVNRYGYWKLETVFPIADPGLDEHFTVSVLDPSDGSVLCEGDTLYDAGDVLPAQISVTTVVNGVTTEVIAAPGARRDFESLNRIFTFGTEYGSTLVRIDLDFNDSDPDETGMTDARRVAGPLLRLTPAGTGTCITYRFYEGDRKSFTYRNEELDCIEEDVPYSTNYFLYYYDYEFGAMDIVYDLFESASDLQLTPLPESSDYSSVTERLCYSAEEAEAAADALLSMLELASSEEGGAVSFSASAQGRLETEIPGLKAGEIPAYELDPDAGLTPDSDVILPGEKAEYDFTVETDVEFRAVSAEEAAAMIAEAEAEGGRDYLRVYDADSGFIRFCGSDESIRYRLKDSGKADLLIERTISFLIDSSVLPAGTLADDKGGGGFMMGSETVLSIVSDAADFTSDVIIGDSEAKYADTMLDSAEKAQKYDGLKNGIGTAVNVASFAKTAYDEAHNDRRSGIKSVIQSYKDKLSALRRSYLGKCKCPTPEARNQFDKVQALDFQGQSELDELTERVNDSNLGVSFMKMGASLLSFVPVPGLSTAVSTLIDTVSEGENDYEDFIVTKDAEQILVKYERLFAKASASCSMQECEDPKTPAPVPPAEIPPDPPGGGSVHLHPRRIIDPSGIVYECIPSNPLGGVTVTIEYLDEDSGSWKEWTEAPEFEDQQTSYVTDASGCYKWDVPDGRWRVRYEKEGYNGGQPYYSQEMDVPPVWTDVNQNMTSAEGFGASAEYRNGKITLRFEKPVTETDVTPEKILLLANGTPVSGGFEITVGEQGYAVELAFDAVPSGNRTYGVRVREVHSYAGTPASFEIPVDLSGFTDDTICPAVSADTESGTVVGFGTAVRLSSAEGATIYYTTDGSCPCNDTPSRQVYDGPITVTQDTYIIACAVKDGLKDSPTKSFIYYVDGLPEGPVDARIDVSGKEITAAVYVDLSGVSGFCDVLLAYYDGGRFLGLVSETFVNADLSDHVTLAKKFTASEAPEQPVVRVMVVSESEKEPLLPAAVFEP